MATGYTIYIENGEITNGKDFLLLCAQKDESVTRPISKYKKNNMERAKKQYEDEIRRIERRKQFVNDFVESLKQIEEENK